MSLQVPVIFFIWRRPELTAQVFAKIAEARPNTLIIVADGPLQNDPESESKCLATREIVREINWPCAVHRDYADHHLGLQSRVESGLDYAFSLVDRAIILEDDCLPEPSFFQYAENLLDFYESDEQIACISGDKPPGVKFEKASYAFTIYTMIWGWATWRRVWLKHDRHMSNWPAIRESDFLLKKLGSPNAAAFWQAWFDKQYSRENNSWAIGFTFSCFLNDMRSIIPSNNLIANIGFGADSTHTFDPNDPRSNVPTKPILLPLVHPSSSETATVDAQIERTVFSCDPEAHL